MPNTPMRHWLSRCSTSTPRPVAAQRSPIAASTGRATSSHVATSPSAAIESSTSRLTAVGSIASAARPSPRARGPAPGIRSDAPPPPRPRSTGGGRDDRTEHAGTIGSIGCRHLVLGGRRRGERRPRAQRRDAGAGVAGGLGGCGPLHEGALHELQAGHVGRRVAAVPAAGVPAGPDPVPAVPGAQGRRRDAEPAGRPGDRQVGLVHVSTEASIFCRARPSALLPAPNHHTAAIVPRCMSRSGVPVRAAAGCVRRPLRRGGCRDRRRATCGRTSRSGVDTTGRGRSPSRRTARRRRRQRSGGTCRKPCADFLEQGLTRFYGGHHRD